MKSYYFLILLIIIPFTSFANDLDENTAAIDGESGNAILYGKTVLNDRLETKNIIDRKNMRIEVGPGTAIQFKSDDDTTLFRGSMICESKQERFLYTANSKITFYGKIILSYDYRERSSSVFVLYGNAKIKNSHNGNSEKNLARNEGAVLISGDFYPNVLRDLSFVQVNHWLEKFSWNKNRREELIAELPTVMMKSPEEIAKESLSERAPSSENKTSLLNYFSTVDEINEIPTGKYEKEFTSSALRGKEHSSLEETLLKKEEIDTVSPEDAAIIPLPSLGLKPEFSITTKEEERFNYKKVNKKTTAKRLPASMKKVIAKNHTQPKDPAIERTLGQLNQIEDLEKKSSRDINSISDDDYGKLDENF